jgi:hypothetical protein
MRVRRLVHAGHTVAYMIYMVERASDLGPCRVVICEHARWIDSEVGGGWSAAPFEACLSERHANELKHVLLGGCWARNVVELEGLSRAERELQRGPSDQIGVAETNNF